MGYVCTKLPDKDKDKTKWLQAVLGELQAGHQEEFLYWKGGQTLEWATQGNDKSHSLEVFKK